jgi:superfamily II DNA or RNA helicase
MTRDERQDISVDKYCKAGYRATIEAVTGFGKTRIAIKLIHLLRRNDKTRKVIVVVPTRQLKQQWQDVLSEYGQLEYTEVYVINTLVNLKEPKCSLLILDEIHRYAARTFSLVFQKVFYQFLLGLTATMSRLDRKHVFLEKYAPICDRITMAECRRNKWISATTEYNLGVTMTPEQEEQYESLRAKLRSFMDKFGQDFETMKNCAKSITPKRVFNSELNAWTWVTPPAVAYARSLGWTGNSVEQAYHILQENKKRPSKEKLPVWGNFHHPNAPEKLNVYAINGLRVSGKIKSFIHNLEIKIDVAEALLKALKLKTITFAESVSTAEELAARIGDNAVVYHSDVKARIINGKKISGAQLKRDALSKIASGEANVICTAKSLDEGFDSPDIQCGIVLSRTSAPRQYIQRRGRVSRQHTFENGQEKESIFINIYVKGTKDEIWLTKSQKADAAAIWVESVEELLSNEGILPSVEESVG